MPCGQSDSIIALRRFGGRLPRLLRLVASLDTGPGNEYLGLQAIECPSQCDAV